MSVRCKHNLSENLSLCILHIHKHIFQVCLVILANTSKTSSLSLHYLFFPQVHRAFDILVGGQGSSTSSSGGSGSVEAGAGNKEKGYVAALYAGIRRCEEKRHIHIPADTDYVTHLITRAEPELQGRCVPVWIRVCVFFWLLNNSVITFPLYKTFCTRPSEEISIC